MKVTILIATTNSYTAQAVNMLQQLEFFGFIEDTWVVPLEILETTNQTLLTQHVSDRITSALVLPPDVKTSANMIFLPAAAPQSDAYIIIDTDIIIHRREFILNLIPDRGKINLVEHDFLWNQGLSSFGEHAAFDVRYHYAHLLEERVIQTGCIGLTQSNYHQIYEEFISDLLSDRQYKGDFVLWNHWVRDKKPYLFNLLPPEVCLVLRPDGSGTSSRFNLPHLSLQNETLSYKGRLVDAVHYTSSRGKVILWQDYKQLWKLISG